MLVPSQVKRCCAQVRCSGMVASGYLITPTCLVTCAHDKLNVDDTVELVFVDGAYDGEQRCVTATVIKVDYPFDCALLRLPTPAYWAEPLPLAPAAFAGSNWECLGFPELAGSKVPLPISLRGEVKDPETRGPKGKPGIQLYASQAQGEVLASFSGAPVWLDEEVIGHLKQIFPDEPGTPTSITSSAVNSNPTTVGPSRNALGILYACPAQAIWNNLQEEDRKWIQAQRAKRWSSFVPPDNFLAMLNRLDQQHALIIAGSPGTGKSSCAARIGHHYRVDKSPSFDVVTIARTDGLEKIRTHLSRQGDHILILIEDPWGHEQLEQSDWLWSSLPDLMRDARADKRFLITTRREILHRASRRQERALSHRIELLGPANYPDSSRWQILLNRLKGKKASSVHFDFAYEHKFTILRRLTTPISLDVLARAIVQVEQPTPESLESLLSQASADGLSGHVAQDLAASPIPGMPSCTDSAAGLYALLLPSYSWQRGGVAYTTELLSLAQEAIEHASPTLSVDLEQLANHLQVVWPASGESSQLPHPEVFLGLRQFVFSGRVASRRVLKALFRGLVQLGHFNLARGLFNDHLRQLVGNNVELERSLYEYELRMLVDGEDNEFQVSFDRVVKAMPQLGSATPVELIIAALIQKRTEGRIKNNRGPDAMLGPPWVPPEWSQAQSQAVGDSQEARIVAGRYIRLLLVDSRLRYSNDEFLALFNRLGWDMVQDFRQAARTMEPRALYGQDGLIIGVALTGRDPPYDELIDRALSEIASFDNRFAKEDERKWAQAEQMEADPIHPDYPEHYFQTRWEWEHFLAEVVLHRRNRDGYQWILARPRNQELVSSWIEALKKSAEPLALREIKEILGVLEKPADRATVYRLLGRQSQQEFVPLLCDKIAFGEEDDIDACIESLVQLLPQAECDESLCTMSKNFSFPQRALISLSYMEKSYQFTDTPRPFPLGMLSPAEQTALSVLPAVRRRSRRSGGIPSSPDLDGTTPFLRELAVHGTEKIALDAISALHRLSKPIVDLLPRLIRSEDYHVRLRGYEFLTQANPEGYRRLFRRGLADPDYRVRIAAMTGVAMLCSEGDDDQQTLVTMSKDASAGVREKCANLIAERGWRSAIPILCELLSDRYDGGLDIGAQDPETVCIVARAAVSALESLKPIPYEFIHGPRLSIKRNSLPSLDMEVNASVIRLTSEKEGGAEAFASLLEYGQLRGEVLLALLMQVKLYPTCRDIIPVDGLLEIASDHNIELAAWALAILGALNQRAWRDCRRILTEGALAEPSLLALIFGAGAVHAGLPVPEFLGGLLDSVPGGYRVLERCQLGHQALAEWQGWLAGNDAAAAWLLEQRHKSDDETQPVRRLLLTVLSNTVGIDLTGDRSPSSHS